MCCTAIPVYYVITVHGGLYMYTHRHNALAPTATCVVNIL